MDDWKQDRIGAAERGENLMTLTRMRSGFAVIGDDQFLPGYCLPLASSRADHLTDLPFAQRSVYLQDMSLIGEAIMRVCAPLRMNYEILGTYDHYLHPTSFPAMPGSRMSVGNIPSGCIPSLPQVVHALPIPKRPMEHCDARYPKPSWSSCERMTPCRTRARGSHVPPTGARGPRGSVG